MITIAACESQPIVVEGLRRSLETTKDLQFVGAATTPKGAVELIEQHKPSVALLDKAFGTKAVFQLVTDIKAKSPGTEPILWAAEISEIESFRALQVGARGILKKTLPVNTLLDCLRTVARGNIWIENSISDQFVGFINRRNTPHLTAREEEIVALVARGMKNKQIADSLCITTGTVKVHLMHIFEKTGVKDRFELAMYGRRMDAGLMDLEDPVTPGGGISR
jgi:DNA-binding NarL/FixJ family response regulator